jgi:transposase
MEEIRQREVWDLPWRKYQTIVGSGVLSGALPEVRAESRNSSAVAEQGAVQQGLRGCGGVGVRIGRGSAGGPPVWVSGGHRAGHRSTVSGAVGEERKKPVLRQMGVDEIYLGKTHKFLTVVGNLETGEPLWFGRDRKQETLDEFFRTELSAMQRGRITAACVDMWEPFTASILSWAPQCRIVYDKFHVIQHAGKAVDEVRRAEFFRKGGRMRGLVKGKRWLLLSRWVNLDSKKRQLLNELFRLNKRMMKAYLLKESLDRLWTYRYEGAALRYLNQWIDQLRWQRLEPFKKLTEMLLGHLEGILNYCRVPVRFGVVEAVNGNIKALLRRGRGYKNLRYLLLKAQRLAALKTEFLVLRKAA